MPLQTSTNEYQETKYIVDKNGGTPYATIQSAINSANAIGVAATIFVRPGTYTENLTLYDKLEIQTSGPNETNIIGTHTPPAAGIVYFTNLLLTAFTGSILSSSATGATTVQFVNCIFNVSSGYVCDLANWTGPMSFSGCTDISANSGIINNATGTSKIGIYNSLMGAGTNALAIPGITTIFDSQISCPIHCSGNVLYLFDGSNTFLATITSSSAALLSINSSRIATGSSPAISHGSTAQLTLSSVIIDSTNANAITGAGTGLIQTSEIIFVNTPAIASGLTFSTVGVVETAQIWSNTTFDTQMTGFLSWAASGPYFDDTTLGAFNLLVGGTGYVLGKQVTWVAQNITGLTAGNTWFIYIDSTGTIGKTNSRTNDLYLNNIVLFECWHDSTSPTTLQHTVKENHPYNYETTVSNWVHGTINIVVDGSGANISLVGTTGIGITGSDTIDDHGLSTTVPDSGGAAVIWNKVYTNSSGFWAVQNTTNVFGGFWNNGGTPTALTGTRAAVYRLYASKENLNSATPVYFAVLDTTDYSNQTTANTAIANGTPAQPTNELLFLELVQLGYITFRSGAITSVVVSKTTARSAVTTGGTNIAALVTTNISAFNGILSSADTNVQAALDTIDDWGALATNHGVLLGRGVNTPIGAIVGTDYQLINGVTGADPIWTSNPTVGGNLTVNGLIALPTTTATVGQITINGNPWLQSFGTANTFVGQTAGNLTLTTANNNSAFGIDSLNALTTGNYNTAIGSSSLKLLTTGSSNVALGINSGEVLLTGTDNTLLGNGAGISYTTSESDNICIGSSVGGTVGESFVLRIGSGTGTGSAGNLNAAYICGIYGKTVGATSSVTIIDSLNNIGALAGAANTVLVGGTSPSFTGSPSLSGTVTAGTGFVATTGNITATAGNIVITAGNLTLPTTSSTVGQITINGNPWLQAYGTSNTFVGQSAGNFTLTTGTSIKNTALGASSLNALTSGTLNVAIGETSGTLLTSGGSNVIIGEASGAALLTGSNNVFLGKTSGSAYTTSESSNICIGSAVSGTVGESHVLRIGNATGTSNGNLNAAYICGIYGKTVGATSSVTIIDSLNNIGALAGAANTVLVGGTSPSFTGSPSLSGTVTAGTGFVATTGNITATAGNIVITAGNLTLPTTSSTVGQITINGNPWLQAYGTSNTFVGQSAGNFTLTTGTSIKNTALGASSLNALTSGTLNVAIGETSGTLLTSGGSNVIIGEASGAALLTGSNNVFLGKTSGSAYTTSESSNICIGSAVSGTVGESHVLRIGNATGTSNGNLNAAYICGIYGKTVGATSSVTIIDSLNNIGALAGAASTFLVGGTAPSFSASPTASGTITGGTGLTATTGAITATSGNVVITNGNLTLPATSSTVGQIVVGGSNWAHSYGSGNIFLGDSCGNFTLTVGTAINNVAVGNSAFNAVTTGVSCTAIGYASLGAVTSGSQNTAVGNLTASTLTTGTYNSFFGYHAGFGSITTGSYNVFLGPLCGGAYSSSESSNILIGYAANNVAGESNVLRIGAGSGTGAGNLAAAYIHGITGVTVTGSAVLCSTSGQLGTVASSIKYKENVKDMDSFSDVLYKLRPVIFNYKSNPEHGIQPGLIAEEVQEIIPSLVVHDESGEPHSVKYHDLPSMLINEIQKLNKRIEALESQINSRSI